MSETEFLSIKDFDGKLRKSIGSVQAVGIITSLTASGGKDMYVAVAFADTNQDDTANSNNSASITLVVNGVIVDRQLLLNLRTVSGGGTRVEFKWKGFVTTGQTISINIEFIDFLAQPVTATLECFEEDTGTSPQIPST